MGLLTQMLNLCDQNFLVVLLLYQLK